jgi:hypothetical protein
VREWVLMVNQSSKSSCEEHSTILHDLELNSFSCTVTVQFEVTPTGTEEYITTL